MNLHYYIILSPDYIILFFLYNSDFIINCDTYSFTTYFITLTSISGRFLVHAHLTLSHTHTHRERETRSSKYFHCKTCVNGRKGGFIIIGLCVCVTNSICISKQFHLVPCEYTSRVCNLLCYVLSFPSTSDQTGYGRPVLLTLWETC